ncbi:MFS general substrate transporter [Wolfiporia cocos MD-104 SS10]|uniref:MFS general substrate transporter n=1 Tax=Wolfiporia cocos (strain MD-104) TaxID=742152 RepID=A0A2H3J1I3_WOLCO|nr:MFS general substrate transporter [Wolfiporia cocos MD-104 SS10]
MSKSDGSVQINEKETPVVEQHSPVEPNSTLDGILVNPNARQAAERELVRLLDMRLLPTIIVIYVLNYIDRVAVTSARLQGLEQDLNLTGIQYNTVIAILFASYAPFQIPSNMELAFRGAIFLSGLLISNAFGSLIAAGILGGMQGKRGIAAWRWLFYIEGCTTIFVGIASIFLLPDYPHNTRWLTLAQRRLAQIRLAEDAGEADEDGTNGSALIGLKLALKDPKVPIMALVCFSETLGLGFINFFPT